MKQKWSCNAHEFFCAARGRSIAGPTPKRIVMSFVGLAVAVVLSMSAITLLASQNLLAQQSLTSPAPLPVQLGTNPPSPLGKLIEPARANPRNLLVRGYVAVAVGRSGEAERSGLYSRVIAAKDIYLPDVAVYLSDPTSGKTSDAVKTDLSGRFTLTAPDHGRYQVCWKSAVYGAGCDGNIFSVGVAPQFLSAVRIRLQKQPDHVAVIGHVTSADGSLTRTFDPMLNINAFATVNLHDEKDNRIAAVYVNNFGDYLLPYVPVKQKIKLVASTEAAAFVQEIRPEAQIEVAALHEVNLKFENYRPRIEPLTAIDTTTNRRVQNAPLGATVSVTARASDRDGDPVEIVWFVDPADGALASTTGKSVAWTLPKTPGRYSLTAIAYDGKGGYDKAVLSVLATGEGVPFTGIVVTPAGAPVADASVEIVGNPHVKTDGKGHFRIVVKEADRYVFNVRKEGFALNSRVYDGGVTGGRWILRPAQTLMIDPTRNTRITHRRSDNDCPGPDSTHVSLGPAGASLTIPQWQDGKGNAVDPPLWWEGPRTVSQIGKGNIAVSAAERRRKEAVILPRELRLPKCGPGITVEIPANSILDANGGVANVPFRATISTVDLMSPQQMPGEDTVLPRGGGGAYLKSFGAGALDLPPGYKMRENASAQITIPVDRARLNGVLPPSVPLLSYDEVNGLWVEEDTLALSAVNGVQVYSGAVKHFTTYNADTFFNNAACLRVFSPSLPGQYNLEVMSPYPDGTPHYKNYPIDNVSSTEHVIYNITPNANMTLAPSTQGANPQLMGFYVVNSGPPETPPNSPNAPPGPPYTSCNNFVVLKVGNAPDSPFGGEFLHGLGFINAANIGFDDLTAAGPTGNALRDAVVAAARDYYTTVDPDLANNRDTFQKFKDKNGFGVDPEVTAEYANSGDLGFGRSMHCLKKANGNVACYVTNFGTGYSNIAPGGGTSDQDDADAAGSGVTVGLSAEVATVAMEYAPIENDPQADKVVKFFVYKKGLANYGRSISANLDGRGERPVPQLCMICHGGLLTQQQPNGVPVFGSANDVKLGARFLPFDHRLYTFPSDPAKSKANQEAAIKSLNKNYVDLVPAGAPASDPIREVIKALYDDGSPGGAAAQILDSPVTAWKAGQPAPNNLPGQTNFYNKVVANGCRICHTAQPFPQLQFNTADKFVNLAGVNLQPAGITNKLMLGTAQLRVCGDFVMAHALRTHDIFWGNYTQIQPAIAALSMWVELQNFGNGVGGSTWKPGLCTSILSSLNSSPSNFYQQSIQPILNSKCVACHIVGGQMPFLPLTDGVSYPALVPSEVAPPNDADNSGALLQRITGVGPGSKMPLGCVAPPTPPGPGQLPCLEQADIDKIKAWIRNGAH
jgi:hypothetical protein